MLEPRPARVVHADLADGLPQLEPGEPGRDIFLVLWWRGTPLGQVQLNHLGLPARALAEQIAHVIARPVGDRLWPTGFRWLDTGAQPPLPPEPPVLGEVLRAGRPLERLDGMKPRRSSEALTASVVICTRNRPLELERCLASLERSSGSWAEVIVVDNAPSTKTRSAAVRFGAHYVAEPRPGLSRARNAGVAAASADVVAFVDDDTEVDPCWLERLLEGFDDPRVMSVTGLVLPAELDGLGQVAFERALGGFGRGYHRLDYGREFFAKTRAQGAPVWKVGAGANMAVRTRAFELVGGFDERLGAGAAGCSEDSEFWYRLLARGWECRYTPDSVVHHHHRRDLPALERQAHEYIRGHVAALFVQFSRHRHRGNLRRAFFAMPRHLVQDLLLDATQRTLARLGVVPPLLPRPARASLLGYLRGLRFAKLVYTSRRQKARLGAFLRQNPFPNPLTEGLFYREKMRAIHRVSPDAPLLRVLEVGGGQSGMARKLYPQAHVTTVDMEPQYANSPLNQGPKVTFVTADATALPFPDASFDAVTFFDVLEHIADDRAAAREAWRVLKPGGWIMASSPNHNWRSPYYAVMAPMCFDDREMMERWGHVRRGYDLVDFERLFGAAAVRHADFINPVTVITHDIAFSRLPRRLRRLALVVLLPLTWTGYLLQERLGRGTETAASWHKAPR